MRRGLKHRVGFGRRETPSVVRRCTPFYPSMFPINTVADTHPAIRAFVSVSRGNRPRRGRPPIESAVDRVGRSPSTSPRSDEGVVSVAIAPFERAELRLIAIAAGVTGECTTTDVVEEHREGRFCDGFTSIPNPGVRCGA